MPRPRKLKNKLKNAASHVAKNVNTKANKVRSAVQTKSSKPSKTARPSRASNKSGVSEKVKGTLKSKASAVRNNAQDRRAKAKDKLKERLNNSKDNVASIKAQVKPRKAPLKNAIPKIKLNLDLNKSSGRVLDVRTWPTNDPNFRFPESNQRGVRAANNVGVAFSGGGTRSMSLSLGYLRALSEMGVIEKIRYFGAISGGSWATVPFCYLPEGISDEQYLGNATPMAGLDVNRINRIARSDGIMARHISQSHLAITGIEKLAIAAIGAKFSLRKIPVLGIKLGFDDVDETWGRTLGQVFLRDLQLEGNRYAGWYKPQTRQIIQRNTDVLGRPDLDLNDFFLYQRKRPFLVVNGAMNQDKDLLPDRADDQWRPLGFKSWEHFEYTPYYSGIHRKSRGRLGLNVGGGYMENIGVDALPLLGKNGLVSVTPGREHHRFSPQDMMAVSGAAPAFVVHAIRRLHKLKLLTLGGVLPNQLFDVFPKYRDWPVQYRGKPKAVERKFGDGGYVDNYGIIPLLKRRVRKIIVFINTETPLSNSAEQICNGSGIDSFLHTLFGVTSTKPSFFSPSDFLQEDHFRGRSNGQVFHKKDFEALARGLASKVNGRSGYRGPVFHRDNYITKENQFFGVPGGHRCEVLWIYNEMNNNWLDDLPRESSRMIENQIHVDEGLLRHFPHVPTFGASLGAGVVGDARFAKNVKRHGASEAVRLLVHDSMVDLEPCQTNLLASLAHYNAFALEQRIREMVG